MNIELVGLPCSGKTTMVKQIMAETSRFRKARFRHKLLSLLLNPKVLIHLIRLTIRIYKKNVSLMASLSRSIQLMPLPEAQHLISDEGVIVYASAIGMDPTNTDFDYLGNTRPTLYMFLEPSEDVLHKQMAKRGRKGIEYSPSQKNYKVSFKERLTCFENWKAYLKKNGSEYIVFSDFEDAKLRLTVRDFVAERF